MMEFLLFSFLGLYALWVYYLAVMNLKRGIDAGTAHPVAKWLGYLLVLPPGLFLDWLMNMVVFTVFMFDLPAHKGELVTGRLQRYAFDQKQTWRRHFAIWFSVAILEAFDPQGYHVLKKN